MRTSPRISVNKLSEYLVAAPARRRRLIAEQKKPVTFMVNYYANAEEALVKFVLGGCADESILHAEINRLSSAKPLNEQEEWRNQTNAEALGDFLDFYDELDFTNRSLAKGLANPPKIVKNGVEISVRPEIIQTGSDSKGSFVGALKIYFSKNVPLTEETGAYIAAVVFDFAQANLQKKNPARPQECLVVDVFGRALFRAPKATTRRMQDIDAACQEIALIWPTL